MVDRALIIPKYTIIHDTYTVLDLIGAGAFGVVYKVRHKFLGLQAIKVFNPGSITLKQEPQLFVEAFMLSKFTHENVVRVYEANTFGFNDIKYCYIAMEYVSGGTLAKFIEKKTRLPVKLAFKIQKDICAGLALAHSMKPPVVHRDVKPQNVMLGIRNNNIIAKVSDFGLANHVDPVTRVITAAGTLAYLPPEGFWNYETPASDVFSAGIIFYIMLTGIAPFKMPSGYESTVQKEIKMAILSSRSNMPSPPSKYNPELDKHIDNIVLKALDPNLKNRYGNAEEFQKALDSYQSHQDQVVEDAIQEALSLGRQYNTLESAIQLLEKTISEQVGDRQAKLKDHYSNILNNWKKGMVL